jgi:AcrR family transcriptional regulator
VRDLASGHRYYPQDMAKLRWGESAPEDLNEARTRLVDAAEACFDRYGVLKTTVEDVATEAHVSRATVYRYFTGRDDLILAVLLREAGRFLGLLNGKVQKQANLADALVEGVLFTVDSVRKDPHLALLFTPEAAGLTSRVAGASEALFSTTAEFLRPLLADNDQLRAGVNVEEASEWLLRVILSLLTAPGPVERGTAAQRRYLHTFLVPALVADRSAARPPRRAPLRAKTRRS